ncbi:MAG: signal peptidase I [Verrucomicrobiota bacterium]
MAAIIKRLIIGRNFRRTMIRASLLILLSIIIFRFVLVTLRLNGISMEPTFFDGRMSVANRLAYIYKEPERGDVVAVRMRNSGRSIFLLKRIVGLPGESIGFKDGKVTVDGVPLEEDYLAYDSDWNRSPVLCEANEYFVVGDNRSMEIERHAFGRTSLSRIVGKVIF